VTGNGGIGGRRRRRPEPFKDWPLSGVLIRFDLHYLSLVREWSERCLGGDKRNRDPRVEGEGEGVVVAEARA